MAFWNAAPPPPPPPPPSLAAMMATQGGVAIGAANHTHGIAGASGNHSHNIQRPLPGRDLIETWLGGNQTNSDVMRAQPSNYLLRLLMIRLRVDQFGEQPFDFLGAHMITNDKYVVFAVRKGHSVILEDGNLFPSDTLITQLRMLRESTT